VKPKRHNQPDSVVANQSEVYAGRCVFALAAPCALCAAIRRQLTPLKHFFCLGVQLTREQSANVPDGEERALSRVARKAMGSRSCLVCVGKCL